MPAENDLGDWFRSIPIVSRWWFVLSIVFTLLGRFGVINIGYMFLSFELVAYKFQIWRLFTCLVCYPLSPPTGFHYLINLYFLYSYSTRLESGVFNGRSADHLFLLLFNSVILIIIGFLANIFIGVSKRWVMDTNSVSIKLQFLMDPLIMSVLYIWCQINRDAIVQFWFGMQFKAMYLPWVLAVFNMVIGGGGLMEIVGIFVGHLYFFLMFKYPQDFGGVRFINTPSFLYKLLPNSRAAAGGFGVRPANRPAQDNNGEGEGRHNWGQGHRLEDD